MNCKNCGQQVDEKSLFCNHCGAKISDTNEITSDNSIMQQEGEELASESNAENIETNESKSKSERLSKIFKFGLMTSTCGVVLFLSIVIISLIGWGKIYLFGGYDFTATLAGISMFAMIAGITSMGVCFGLSKIGHRALSGNINKKTISIILVLSILLSIWGFVDLGENSTNSNSGNNSGGSSSSGSSGGGYGGSNNYDSGTSKLIGLSLKVDSIKKSGSYTYVYCTVTNVSSKYVATKYRYVKVKAQFKNYSGQIVDTDWTYAVDSTWLEPGESKTFYYMVKNTSISSAVLSFVD